MRNPGEISRVLNFILEELEGGGGGVRGDPLGEGCVGCVGWEAFVGFEQSGVGVFGSVGGAGSCDGDGDGDGGEDVHCLFWFWFWFWFDAVSLSLSLSLV